MNSKTFEIVAAVLSYWFAAVMVYLLLRLLREVWRDYAADRVRRRQAEGYSMGMLEVIAPATDRKGRKNPLYGARFALRRENLIGSAGKCDIRLKDRSVAGVQASVYQKGNQVLLSDYGTRRGVLVNGHRVRKDLPLLDGDEIALGDVVLRLHIKGGTAPAAGREGYEKQEQQPVFDDELWLGDEPLPKDEPARQAPRQEETPWEDGGYGQRRTQRRNDDPQDDLDAEEYEYDDLSDEYDDASEGEAEYDGEYDDDDRAFDDEEEEEEPSRRGRFGRRGRR